MPPVRQLPPGYTIAYPNRDKATSKLTKAIVVVILLVSIGLMLAITIGGWSKLQGLSVVNFIWCAVYLIMAFYIGARWARGLLPLAAALAILLLIIAIVAGAGASGTSWFDRNYVGYAPATSLFGGAGLSADTLGVLTVLLAPVQVLLIVFAMRGFQQGWNVEVETRIDELKPSAGRSSASGGAAPATA